MYKILPPMNTENPGNFSKTESIKENQSYLGSAVIFYM
jgi:hypothetical protein